MFTVYDKYSGEPYVVYDVIYDNVGFAHFLIFEDGQWIRRSAKCFVPKESLPII